MHELVGLIHLKSGAETNRVMKRCFLLAPGSGITPTKGCTDYGLIKQHTSVEAKQEPELHLSADIVERVVYK